ncbi:MAG: BUG/TctC family periplasmic protein, partial [uncultured Acetobacteraceae bacterium]
APPPPHPGHRRRGLRAAGPPRPRPRRLSGAPGSLGGGLPARRPDRRGGAHPGRAHGARPGPARGGGEPRRGERQHRGRGGREGGAGRVHGALQHLLHRDQPGAVPLPALRRAARLGTRGADRRLAAGAGGASFLAAPRPAGLHRLGEGERRARVLLLGRRRQHLAPAELPGAAPHRGGGGPRALPRHGGGADGRGGGQRAVHLRHGRHRPAADPGGPRAGHSGQLGGADAAAARSAEHGGGGHDAAGLRGGCLARHPGARPHPARSHRAAERGGGRRARRPGGAGAAGGPGRAATRRRAGGLRAPPAGRGGALGPRGGGERRDGGV